MSEITIRPLDDASEADLFMAYGDDPVPDSSMGSHRSYVETLLRGSYRPEWTWIAERDGRVVARAAWYATPDEPVPFALDWLDIGTEPDRLEIGRRMVAAGLSMLRIRGTGEAEMHLFPPTGWRDRPDVRSAVEERLTAAKAGGFVPFVERYSYCWGMSDGLPTSTGRLAFREVSDDELLDLLRQILVDTYDAHSRRDIERHGPEGAAKMQRASFDQFFPSPREWWRVGCRDGEPVGLIVPARNQVRPVVGYLGVLPEHRGQGYVDDLLAEQTRLLAAEMDPHEEIGADTDIGNAPMAAAFARAGYRIAAERLVLTT